MISMLERVVNPNSSIEVIKLFLEQEKQEKYMGALVAFRSTCPPIDKVDTGCNLIGEAYEYAKLERIQEIIDPVLSANGLTYKFNQKQRGNMVTVQCLVAHIAGHKESTTMSAAIQETEALVSEQQTAVTTSYLKRYTLSNALGLVIKGQDTDGQIRKSAPRGRQKPDYSRNPIKGGVEGLREAVARTERKTMSGLDHVHTVQMGSEHVAGHKQEVFMHDHTYTPPHSHVNTIHCKPEQGRKVSHYKAEPINGSASAPMRAVPVYEDEVEWPQRESFENNNEMEMTDELESKGFVMCEGQPFNSEDFPELQPIQSLKSFQELAEQHEAQEMPLVIENDDEELNELIGGLEADWEQDKKQMIYELVVSLTEAQQEEFTATMMEVGELSAIQDVAQVAGFAKVVLAADKKAYHQIVELMQGFEDFQINDVDLALEDL